MAVVVNGRTFSVVNQCLMQLLEEYLRVLNIVDRHSRSCEEVNPKSSSYSYNAGT
jgi:hypothetical protein